MLSCHDLQKPSTRRKILFKVDYSKNTTLPRPDQRVSSGCQRFARDKGIICCYIEIVFITNKTKRCLSLSTSLHPPLYFSLIHYVHRSGPLVPSGPLIRSGRRSAQGLYNALNQGVVVP